jgi:hypothetical protein
MEPPPPFIFEKLEGERRGGRRKEKGRKKKEKGRKEKSVPPLIISGSATGSPCFCVGQQIATSLLLVIGSTDLICKQYVNQRLAFS